MGNFPFGAGQQVSKLQGWYAGLGNRASANVSIACIGDSVTAGNGAPSFAGTYVQQLAAALNARIPTAGLATHGRGFLVPVAFSVTPWASSSYSVPTPAFSGPALSAGFGCALWGFNLATQPVSLAYSLNGDSADILYAVGPGFGTFGWKVDAGAVTNQATANATFADGQVLHVSLGAAGAHTLTLTSVTAGNGIFLDGVTEYNGDYQKGIQVHGCGLGGTVTANWTQAGGNQSQPNAVANGLKPNLLVIELGANDAGTGVPVGTFYSNLKSVIAFQRAAYANPPPIVLLMTYNAFANGNVTAAQWAAYVSAAAAIASADSQIAVLDLTQYMPPTNSANTWGLYYSDNIHPSGEGHQVIADLLAGFLTPP